MRKRAISGQLECRQLGEIREAQLPDGRPGVTLHCVKPGVVDEYGSLWMADAFDESLAQRMPTLVWSHDWTEPLGPPTAFRISPDGPQVDFVFSDFEAVPTARRAYAQVKDGTIQDCSVGFCDTERRSPTDAEKEQYPGVQEVITKATLDEVSLVLRGAVPGAKVVAVRSASGRTDWPLADRGLAWDGAAAHNRLVEWATDGDQLDPAKMRSVHFWVDPDKADQVGGYKLAFCDVTGGAVRAVPRGIFACAGVMNGAMGGVDLPEADRAAVQSKIEAYYRRMAKEFDDQSIKVPWSEASAATIEIRAGSTMITVSEDLVISLAKRIASGEITQTEAKIALDLAASDQDDEQPEGEQQEQEQEQQEQEEDDLAADQEAAEQALQLLTSRSR